MSEVSMAKLSMERCLLDMPHKILLEIFHGLSKGKLSEIYRLCPKFRDVAGDARLWKDVYIKYEEKSIPFEELYSGPWPVKVIDLSRKKIGNPPVPPQTDQVVKVTKLDLSQIKANEVTINAILAKYQCTELNLSFNSYVSRKGHVMGIAPEAFSKQTALEVLSLKCTIKTDEHSHQWLVQVLNYCKHLKTLDLSFIWFSNSDMLDFVKKLPTSLEKLYVGFSYPKDTFFQLLAESCPNLRELELDASTVKCPYLIDFQFLEALRIISYGIDDISDMDMYLKKLKALKTVDIIFNEIHEQAMLYSNIPVQKLLTSLKPHGIIVGVEKLEYFLPKSYPKDNNLWKVSSATEPRKNMALCLSSVNLVRIFSATSISLFALWVIFRKMFRS